MKTGRSFARTLAAVAALALAGGTAWAAQGTTGKETTGKVSIESMSVAAGLGYAWGNGVLEYRGAKYPFTVTAFSIVDVGVAKVFANGDVFNLKNVEDFEGMFMAAVAGATLGGGRGCGSHERRSPPRHAGPLPRPLFAAETFAALQVRVTDGAVHVQRALFEALEQVQVERALVDDVAHLHAQAVPDERQDVGERVHRTVDRLPDAVADRQRLQERHDDVPAGSRAVDTQRLSEVFTALQNTEHVLGRIEETPDARRAVDEEARHLAAGAQDLALEQVVDEPRHERDVVEAVRDHGLDLVGDDEVVALGDRLEDVIVHPPVEIERLRVPALPRIVRFGLHVRGRLARLRHAFAGRRDVGDRLRALRLGVGCRVGGRGGDERRVALGSGGGGHRREVGVTREGGFDGARRADVEGGVDTGCARERAAGRQPERERAEAGDGGEAVKSEPIDIRRGLCAHDVPF